MTPDHREAHDRFIRAAAQWLAIKHAADRATAGDSQVRNTRAPSPAVLGAHLLGGEAR